MVLLLNHDGGVMVGMKEVRYDGGGGWGAAVVAAVVVKVAAVRWEDDDSGVVGMTMVLMVWRRWMTRWWLP
ncbi:hypothetical protein Tco_1534216 [Tanacetum coccineum]